MPLIQLLWTILTGHDLQADKLTTQLRAENENVTAQCSNALARTIESEEALIQSRNEFERVKSILEAELAARQNCIDKVTKEQELLQSAHDSCTNKVSRRMRYQSRVSAKTTCAAPRA